ncbi:MAG TPA: O-antigen ligase family protein [Solirubrobacteraceae bacterium]
MTSRLTASLREAPATVPALAALLLFVVWATDQGGYPVTHWAPGALIVLALLGVSAASVPLSLREIPTPVKIAVLCLSAYTALSFLSIAWAPAPGDAWEGANRTLLYLLVFVLFAAWRQRGGSATLLLCAWTLAMIALATFTLLHLTGANLARLAPDGRLVYPTGYPNANAAQWLMAFWPALLLARSGRLPWGLRGVLAAGAVLLGAVALLSQSRGSLYATPVMLVLVFALLPGRVRTFAALAPVAVGLAALTPAVLRVGDRVHAGGDAPSALHTAKLATLAVALAVGLIVAGWGAIEGRRSFSPRALRRGRRIVAGVAVLTLVAAALGGWVAAGNPVTRVEHGWQSFKGGYASSGTGSRLVDGLGSNRYDFYRVALDEFASHPLVGIGADNYAQQYLRHGRTLETPHYPHSVELRTLTDTGLLGGLLAVVGLAAALTAGWRALRVLDPLERAAAAAALSGFTYWVVHGSVDWFWEFAGLGAPAFALLGLSCALSPRADGDSPAGEGSPVGEDLPSDDPPGDGAFRPYGGRSATGSAPRSPRRWPIAAAVPVALAVTVSFAAPWLSQMQVQSAARIWPLAPGKAYARLEDAASLNPLSDEAYLVAGSIALRFGDLPRADHEFALALKRVPTDAYGTLERGAIASSRGERARSLALLRAAASLNPRDPLTRSALSTVQAGRRVDVQELNRSILTEAQQLS